MKFFTQYRYAQAVLFVARNVRMTPLERATWARNMLNLTDVGFIHKLRIAKAIKNG